MKAPSITSPKKQIPSSFFFAIFALPISFFAQADDPAVAHIRTDKSFTVTRFADKQYVDNPIALSMDKAGALFVAEARRFQKGVEDTRSKSFWMMDELAIQSTADRLAQYKKWTAAGKFSPDHFTNTADRIVKISDSDGDGIADVRSMFSDSFREPLDGNGASVLAHHGKVYYTNIPNLWLLEDDDQDGIADSRVSLQDGFGLRSGVNGHDMHGLEFGPNGKLYWSIGDRGYNFVTKEGKHLKDAETGAVFRCDPDGSNIEVFCRGNRNPQDLAFDAYGNLFTVDNNQGGGDRPRICYLVEGGDYGWNSGCTNLITFRTPAGLSDLKGPRVQPAYMAESHWKQAFPEQPAHVIPAIDFIDGGCAGLTYVPGASLGNAYQQHFVFSALSRGIKSFSFSPEGAGFSMVDYHNFWSGGSPIDTEFGHDGELYVADYARNGGNVFVLQNQQAMRRPSVIEAAKVLRQSFADFANEQLYDLLAQRDQRVRLQAQFELAARGATDWLVKAATTPVPEISEGEPFNGPMLRRLHGIWGLGQTAKTEPLLPLLRDPYFRIRAQSAKILGDHRAGAAAPGLLPLLEDESPRVQAFAATALGKIQHRPAVPALIDLLVRTDNADAFLRHAAIFGLEQIGDLDAILAYADHDSAAVRLAVLVLLRRAQDPRIARYLNDPDPRLVRETIAAINDARIDSAEPALAAHLRSYLKADAVLPTTLSFDRMINAAFRQGQADTLRTLLDVGAATHLPERIRSAALFRLERWDNPYIVDPTLGQMRSYPPDRHQDANMIKAAVTAQLPAAEGQVLSALYHLADIYQVPLDPVSLERRVLSTNADRDQRLQALKSLTQNPSANFSITLETLLQDGDPFIRVAALEVLTSRTPKAAEAHIARFAESGSPLERQAAYKHLASVPSNRAVELLVDGMNELLADPANHDAALELLDACSQRQEPKIQQLMKAYRDSLDANDPLAEYRTALVGGQAERGEIIVREHGTAACIICHSINGEGGVVAPDLTEIGVRARGEYLLESLLVPGAKVVPGFGVMTLTLTSGEILAGSLMSENDRELVLKLPAGSTRTIPVAEIATRGDAISTMPPMHAMLKKREIRDVIAYLRTLNKTNSSPRRNIPEVRNAGVGGNTSGQLLARLDRDVLAHRPSTVVLMVGTNDRLNSRQFTSAADYLKNIENLTRRIRESGAEVLLVTPPPCEPKALFTRHDATLFAEQAPNARMAEIRDLLLAKNQPIIDFHAHVLANTALLSKDGVHLTPEGYRELAKQIAAGLRDAKLDMRRVICFGDSLTAGPYPAELERQLRGYTIGLSMYSLRQLFADGQLSPVDYPAFAREVFGITEIDIWVGALPAKRRDDPEAYRELRRAAEAAGSHIFLLMAGSLTGSHDSPEERAAEVAKFHRPIEHAVTLGADYLRIFLRAPKGPRPAAIAQCTETLRPLADFAASKGIIVVIEPGSSKTSEDGTFLAELAAKLAHPALRLMPDFGKMKNADPYGGTIAMMPYTAVVSAKSNDFNRRGNEANLDYPRLLKSIQAANFHGIIAIEYEGTKLAPIEGIRATQTLLERLRK